MYRITGDTVVCLLSYNLTQHQRENLMKCLLCIYTYIVQYLVTVIIFLDGFMEMTPKMESNYCSYENNTKILGDDIIRFFFGDELFYVDRLEVFNFFCFFLFC